MDDAVDVSDSDGAAEGFDPGSAIQNRDLIRLVRTSAGSELFVNHVAQELLKGVGQTNWGGLLSAAPDALGRLGQCFVLASDPLASSLVFPESAGLKYTSLRANLVHCSDLGRKAFRDAEARMKKVSMVAQAVCEPDGTIDMIIQATEDEDLAELDLPEQLAALKRVSNDCVEDTKAIKEKVAAWSQYAGLVYQACVDKDESLGKEEHDLDGQIVDRRLTVGMKKGRVNDVKSQTSHYRGQLATRQEEVNRANKSMHRGGFTDIGTKLGDAVIDTAMSFINPFSNFSINLGFGGGGGGKKDSKKKDGKKDGKDQFYTPDPGDGVAQQDAGFALADRLLPVVHRFAELLVSGPDDLNGVDWEALGGSGKHVGSRKDAVWNIEDHIKDVLQQFSRENSTLVWQIREEMKLVEEVAEAIRDVMKQERNVNERTHEQVEKSAKAWRGEVRRTETALGKILGARAKKEEERKQRTEIRLRSTKMSPAEIRFERFRMAQQALFDAETKLNQRLEDEMRALEEFNAMQQGLEKLLTSKATLAQVKEIVGECVKHLQLFCEKLDQLTTFFTEMQNYINDIDKHRVDQFSQVAAVAKKLGGLGSEAASERTRLRREKVKQQKLEQLRLKALELKGHYLVAQAMANTYSEVSAKYILPGVSRIDRLSLPDAKSISAGERAQKIAEVGALAAQARKGVKLLANARKEQFLTAMTEQRGVIEEAGQLGIEN
ncbi:hypothetical protein B0T24DRAFT_540422 [Lasiosphaeria ovina]|uniref:Uncharacterized protein n=1 Tax=Lasiosphaeria ovina TaxID=92902 RepID=A0AAE0JRQ8_9PEZI|nr:hypothetical protein B0T24DRAFT_540422 [Lasiosphaeria ovina]